MVGLVVQSIPCTLCFVHSNSFGYVDYLSVDQAKHVFHNRGNIEMDGRIVFVDFATNNINKIRNRDGMWV